LLPKIEPVIIFLMTKNAKNPELSEILDLDKIKVVGNSIEEAHGLPNECYTSSDYLMFERERISRINGQ